MMIEALRPFIVQDTKIVTNAYGDLIFELDLNDTIQRHIFFELYDRDDLDLLKSLLTEGDVVFDIGGNVGLYTIALAKTVGPSGKVHVFEPIPENILAIHRNVGLNHFENRVIENSVAVTDSETTLELHLPSSRDNTGWASIVSTPSRNSSIKVEAMNLDTYVQRNEIRKIKLIKIDIEGAELLALHGMSTILSDDDPPMIYFEINSPLLEKQKIESNDIKQYLARFGYKLYKLKQKTLIPVSADTPENGLCNILAIKHTVE